MTRAVAARTGLPECHLYVRTTAAAVFTAQQAAHRFLTSVVVPRPIAWISTITPDGRTGNLAPHSFFSIAGTDPPIVQFTSTGRKDPPRNVEDTGELRPTELGGDEWDTPGEVLHLNRIPCEEPGTPHDQP